MHQMNLETFISSEHLESGMSTDHPYSVHKALMDGKFTPLDKMLKADLKEECQMWRNIWSWVPSEVKFYASRTGSLIGLQVRNYHRFVGVILGTKWEFKYIDVGVYEKVYDQNDGQYYFERKIVQIPVSQIVAFDWIAERKPEEQVLEEAGLIEGEKELTIDDYELE